MANALSTWLSQGEIRDRIGKALGKSFDPDFYIEQILIALNHPTLALCSDESKFKAAHTCAALGMLPSMQHVALIPRKMKGSGEEVTVMPQWQGLAALMLRHPNVQRISHSLVHPTDEFEFDGTTQTVTHHQFDPFGDREFKTPADIRGGYITVFFKDGQPPVFHTVKASTIAKARKCAQADNIWKNWFEEQCIKTLYRNAFARRVVPIDPMLNQLQIQAALAQEDEVLENNPDRVAEPASNGRAIPAPVSRTAAVAGRLRAPATTPDQAEQIDATPDDAPEVVVLEDEATDGLFEELKAAVLSAASVEELNAASQAMAKDAGSLTNSQLAELTGLMDTAADALKK